NGKNSVAVDLPGNLGSGSSQILIDTIGPKGSTVSWILTAPKPTLKSAKPTEAGPGDSITLTGTNFCTIPQWDVVTFGSKKAEVASATAISLEVKVPDGVESGKQKVYVTVIGQKTE